MSLAATYLLSIGLAALITAAVLHDRGRSRRWWLGGVAFTVAGAALAAVVDFQEHHAVHAGVVAGIAVLCVALIADVRRRRT